MDATLRMSADVRVFSAREMIVLLINWDDDMVSLQPEPSSFSYFFLAQRSTIGSKTEKGSLL